ncbi:MAG TPA: dihydrodipicolinate synthase family protein [Candidatus Polarisedimenticolia bacterium]|jgi:4-hydroxy-2-oxoglutarate aldolase
MFKGLFPPIPTPFVGEEFSPAHLTGNIGRWNELPIEGYVVLGSNGEAPLLDEHERAAVVRTAFEAIPSERTMIVGAGRESTRATMRSVKEAFSLGADAVLVGVPSYFKPAMTDEVLREHYLRVADASPGPLLLYSVPYFTGIPIGPTLFAELIGHDRIVGIKDSSGDPESLRGMIEAARARGRDISVLIGSARALAAGLEMGAAGSVLALAVVAPRACAEIAALIASGKTEPARRRNEELLPLAEAVTRRHGIGGLKAALDLLHFYGGDPRPPLPPAGPAARAEIAELLKRLGLLT